MLGLSLHVVIHPQYGSLRLLHKAVSGFPESTGGLSVSPLGRLGSELIHSDFCDILMIRESQKAYLNLQGGEIDSTF